MFAYLAWPDEKTMLHLVASGAARRGVVRLQPGAYAATLAKLSANRDGRRPGRLFPKLCTIRSNSWICDTSRLQYVMPGTSRNTCSRTLTDEKYLLEPALRGSVLCAVAFIAHNAAPLIGERAGTPEQHRGGGWR
jgi:hypothetical protein